MIEKASDVKDKDIPLKQSYGDYYRQQAHLSDKARKILIRQVLELGVTLTNSSMSQLSPTHVRHGSSISHTSA